MNYKDFRTLEKNALPKAKPIDQRSITTGEVIIADSDSLFESISSATNDLLIIFKVFRGQRE